MNIELKPCPFCGGEAEMMGDQYPYVECQKCAVSFLSDHSYDSDFDDAARKWNARAQGGQGAEPVGIINYADHQSADALALGAPLRMAVEETAPRSIQGLPKGAKLYTQPQPAAPEGIEVAIDMLEDYASALGNGDLDGAGHSTTQAIYEIISLLSTTPQSDGWVKCEDRLPTEEDADCEGCVWLCWPDRKLVERVMRRTASFCDGFWWMPTGLKRPQPPKQEGSGDE